MSKSKKRLSYFMKKNCYMSPSSLIIFRVMNGDTTVEGLKEWPAVPNDHVAFNPCYRLIKEFPEWRSRLEEVSDAFPEWANHVANWDLLEKAIDLDREVKEANGVRTTSFSQLIDIIQE